MEEVFTTLSDSIKILYAQLEQQINSLEKQIKLLPKGKLVCTKNGNYTKWFNSKGNNLIYIKKSNLKLAQDLALKKYYSLQLQDLLKEKENICQYLDSTSIDSASLFFNESGYRELLESKRSSITSDNDEWKHAPYERNTKYSEQLIHKSLSGNMVRSKSEALIDMILYQNKIPYRYETPLTLNGIVIYPDFTIRHPKTGQYIYWEHFGMMDNSSYQKNVFQKLQLYSQNGIIPTIHLITTYETEDCPLTADLIQKIIEHYFM